MPQDSPFVGPPYQWDVFVSYSHGKAPPGVGESQLRGWTTAFVAALTEDLHYALNSPPSEAESNAGTAKPSPAEFVDVRSGTTSPTSTVTTI